MLSLVGQARRRTAAVADEWVETTARHKRIRGTPAEAEEWSLGPLPVVRYLRLIERSLIDLQAGRKPRLFGRPRRGPGDRTRVPMFFSDAVDRAILPGFAAEVWLRGTHDEATIRERQAAAYSDAVDPGATLVLGGGNLAAIPATDALDTLLTQRRTALLKLSPVNDYLEDVLAHALKPFLVSGSLAIVRGDADEGARLVADPHFSGVHVTGSARTFDAVRAARSGPCRLSAELGNVSPVIVVPGRWSAGQLRYQARSIASMVVNNGGFNCAAPRVLVTSSNWPQRLDFLAALAEALQQVPNRFGYYPGSDQRLDDLVAGHPAAQVIGERSADGVLPWVLIAGLDAGDDSEPMFTAEWFTPVLGEVALDTSFTTQHLAAATDWVNERLWGDLCATVVVDPATRARPSTRRALAAAVRELRYGTVAINQWPATAYALGSLPWGAWAGGAGHAQSGSGFVHNTQMLSDVEKVVLQGPFRMRPTPIWFPEHRRAFQAARRLTLLQAEPSARRLVGFARAAALA